MVNKPEFFEPPMKLKSKVSYDKSGVDIAVLEKAEALLNDMQDSYLDWVHGDMDRLEKEYAQAENIDANNEKELKKAFDKIFAVTHDIKGQGGTFGYELMTTVGNILCRFIEKSQPPCKEDLKAVRVHIDTMQLVLAQNVKGDGGKVGQQLLKELDAMVAKLTGKAD